MTTVGTIEVPTPNLDKMSSPVKPASWAHGETKIGDGCKLHDHTELVHQFLEVLRARGITLSRELTDEGRREIASDIGLIASELDDIRDLLRRPLYQREEDAELARFFGIDQQAMEEEKRALLEAIRTSRANEEAARAAEKAGEPEGIEAANA